MTTQLEHAGTPYTLGGWNSASTGRNYLKWPNCKMMADYWAFIKSIDEIIDHKNIC